MGRINIFGDEAGDFVFEPPREGISRYFLIGTITLTDCSVGDRLLALRRDLAFSGAVLDGFHAASDRQWVRNKVFELIAAEQGVRYDVTILDKRKTIEKYRRSPIQFYRLGWYLHLKWLAPQVGGRNDELFVAASSLLISKKKKAVREALDSVVTQVTPSVRYVSAFPPSVSDPCLQVADYCTWAVQRKREHLQDSRSYDLIKHLIKSEFEPFTATAKLEY